MNVNIIQFFYIIDTYNVYFNLPKFELLPSHNQLVYSTDSMKLSCTSTWTANSFVMLNINGVNLKPSSNYIIKNNPDFVTGLYTSTLKIER